MHPASHLNPCVRDRHLCALLAACLACGSALTAAAAPHHDRQAVAVPDAIAERFDPATDPRISDDFNTIDPIKWEKRASKARPSGAAGNIRADHNFIDTEDQTTFLSLRADNAGEAGLSALHPHHYGFTVCRWRVRGLDAERTYAAHPAIWSLSYNMGVTRQNAPNPNAKSIEIDWFEYIKWERLHHARVIPAFDGQSDIPASVFMSDHRTDFAGWKVWGFEYTPEHVRVWEHVQGTWRVIGQPVRFADETSPKAKTIDRDHRSRQYFILSNIRFVKPEYELTPVHLDIDYLHHHPLRK